MAQTPYCPSKTPRGHTMTPTNFITVAVQEIRIGELSAEVVPVSAVCTLLPARPLRRVSPAAADGPARMQSTTQQGCHAHLHRRSCRSGAKAANSLQAAVDTAALPSQSVLPDAPHSGRRIPARLLPWICSACTLENKVPPSSGCSI